MAEDASDDVDREIITKDSVPIKITATDKWTYLDPEKASLDELVLQAQQIAMADALYEMNVNYLALFE